MKPNTIDNGQRTACVDPYSDVDIKFSQLQTYIVLGTGSASFVMSLTILIVFIAKRNTRIVRSSDKTLSILHLSNIMLIISATLYLNLIKRVTVVKCVTTNLILSVFYVINVAFVYTKSQKLLSAFQSKVLLSRKEIHMTSAVQIFTVILFLIISNSIAMVMFTQESPVFWSTAQFLMPKLKKSSRLPSCTSALLISAMKSGSRKSKLTSTMKWTKSPMRGLKKTLGRTG